MRNIYNSYRLCNIILKYGRTHLCGKSECASSGKFGTDRFTNNPKTVKKGMQNKKEAFFTGFGRDIVFEGFAQRKGYVEINRCSNDPPHLAFTSITDKGIELTDNLFLPLTPIGLWKEVYKEHKLFGKLMATIITSLVLSASGITLAYAYSHIRVMLEF